MGIRDLVGQSTRGAIHARRTSYPVLAVTAPKTTPKSKRWATIPAGHGLFNDEGAGVSANISLPYVLQQYSVECLIIDDAHDLSIQHLIFVKEITDQLRLPPYDHALGLCLVTAGRGAAVPLERYLGPNRRPCGSNSAVGSTASSLIADVTSHTKAEMRDILGTLEQVYQPVFGALNLQQWTATLYTWLTHPFLDPKAVGG